MMHLSFHGAAGTVTGSKYLLTVNDESVLIDCGMFQGARELRRRNWDPMPEVYKSLSAVIVSHAHVDHIGMLPKLSKHGFSGPIYLTPPTADLAEMSLLDSAELQEEDADYRNRKKLSRYEQAEPLFTQQDVHDSVQLFHAAPFGNWVTISDQISFRYHVAGHLLGAASVEVKLTDGSLQRTVFFSGDIGRYDTVVTVAPSSPPTCDYLICESTYGGKEHEAVDPHEELAAVISDVQRKKGILLIPAFAIGRTQQITFLVNELIRTRRIDPIQMHIDSPMAIEATDIYVKFAAYHKVDVQQLCGPECTILGKYVHVHRKRSSSKELNTLRGPAIIVSASGMLTGGRILHHLLIRLDDPTTTVGIVGFLPEGTLGRKLLDGEKMVYIHKQPVTVRARIVKVPGLSGHGDFHELLQWLKPIGQPRMTFITHGEPEMSRAMAAHLKEERGWPTIIPEHMQTVELT